MNKKQVFWLVAALSVAVLGYWLASRGGKFAGNYVSPTATPIPSSTAKAPAKPGSSAKSGSSVAGKSYTELVKEYDGLRIQFDQRCQVVPTSVTYKNGTNVMLDNRSNNPVTVKVGDKSYSLIGYGYQVINLSSSSLPKELSLSCGSAGNVGKIYLQASLYQ